MAGSPASRAAVGLSPLCVTLCDSRQCDETPGPGWKEAGLQSGAGVMSPDGPHTRVLDRTARIVSDNTDSGFYLGPPESWFLGSGPGNPVFWNNGGQCEKERWSGNKDPGPAIMEALLSRGVDDEGSGDKEGILCTFTSSPLHPVNLFPKGQGCVKFSSSKQGRKGFLGRGTLHQNIKGGSGMLVCASEQNSTGACLWRARGPQRAADGEAVERRTSRTRQLAYQVWSRTCLPLG